MGTSHVKPHLKPSAESEPVNLKELASGPKHVSFADDTPSQSQLSWSNLTSLSGRLSAFGDRLSQISSASWRSGRSGDPQQQRSPGRPWSRVSRKRWNDSTLQDPLLASKTAWPVSLNESLFLPDFPVKDKSYESLYEVERTLGSGAFGKVFQVKHKESGISYALKVLSKAQVVRQAAIRQVKDEVSIQAACGHHPYIVACPDRWQTRKQLFVLQELVPGGELRDLWLRHGSLHEQLVQLYVAEIAIALDFLHNAGVIFRDLKLENVLLDSEMHVKLIDFGLAKWLRYGARTQTLCGTLQYMAPEVLEQQPYTHSADWWSLGVVAFCLLSGNYPAPPARDPEAMRAALLAGPPSLPCEVSAAARALVSRLLTPEPRHRLNSLLKLAREAWYHKYDLDAVREREVSARHIYDQLYPAGPTCSEDSDDFIDFDATTVDESLGSSELLDEFPSLPDGSPRRGAGLAAASTPCRGAASGAPPCLSPASPVTAEDSVVASSGVLSPHRTFAGTACLGRVAGKTGKPLSPGAALEPPLRATPDSFDETSSGDILELRLPDGPRDGDACSCDDASPLPPLDRPCRPSIASDREAPALVDETGDGVPGCSHWVSVGRPTPAEDQSLKRPGSADRSRDEYERIWKRPRTAPADSWEEGNSGAGDLSDEVL